LWNVIPEHKVLLADLLAATPVWDVSPGEMYFTSFARYFARPRVGSPYLDLRDYGRLLAGAIVKYEGEKARAEEALGIGVDVVMNGVVVPPSPPHRASRPCVVGTLARISPDKKLEQLVDAARHGRFTLRIAGAAERGCDAYLAELRERARGLPVELVGERDAASFLSSIDLFAMVSEPAGCPNATLEAMASGLAVVATDAGAARDQIVHGETGLLVPRGDAEALGEAVARLASDEAKRAAMGRAAHHRAASLFSVDRMAAEYTRLCLARDLGRDVSSAA
jgi:glycosyltransferase involved in cell wall biosynthesis